MTETSQLLADVPLDEYTTLLSQKIRAGFLVTEARSDLLVVELDPMLQRDLVAAGYDILSHDNEGFEAEIFFSKGRDIVGTFSLKNLCEGQISVKLVLGAKRYE